MKYVITGSLGNISKPIVESLVKVGHAVTVVTSSQDKVAAIQSIGALPAVGSVEDSAFVNKTFAGAAAVYLMIPPNWALTGGWLAYQRKVADIYTQAVIASGIKHVVLLSSVGAHMGKGSGPVDGLSYAEWKLNQLKSVNLKILRPSYFFNNLMGQISMIRNMGIMGSNYGGTSEKLVLAHTQDIADVAITELLGLKFKGHTIQYIASDERHPSEIAAVIGKAIGKPGLAWVEFKDADAFEGMLKGGLSKTLAEGYTDLGRALRLGTAQEDYWKNKPKLGKGKLEDFAKAFAQAYNS